MGASTPLATLTAGRPGSGRADPHHQCAGVSAPGIDDIPSVSFDVDIDLVGRSADLEVEKTAVSPRVTLGDTQTFNITVRNNGDSAATAITVEDTLTGLLNNLATGDHAGFVGYQIVRPRAAARCRAKASRRAGLRAC